MLKRTMLEAPGASSMPSIQVDRLKLDQSLTATRYRIHGSRRLLGLEYTHPILRQASERFLDNNNIIPAILA